VAAAVEKKSSHMSKAKTKHIKAKKKTRKNYVVVSNSSYGKALKGQRIYFEGKKPTRLGDDGRITFGKIILEILGKKFAELRAVGYQLKTSRRLEHDVVSLISGVVEDGKDIFAL